VALCQEEFARITTQRFVAGRGAGLLLWEIVEPRPSSSPLVAGGDLWALEIAFIFTNCREEVFSGTRLHESGFLLQIGGDPPVWLSDTRTTPTLDVVAVITYSRLSLGRSK
jgi:hypothetical protein